MKLLMKLLGKIFVYSCIKCHQIIFPWQASHMDMLKGNNIFCWHQKCLPSFHTFTLEQRAEIKIAMEKK